MEVLALIVAALALGFSVFSFFRQFGLQRRLTEIEEGRRREEVESKMSADVTARFERRVTSGHMGYQFVLLNRGPARADDVTFELVEPTEGRGLILMMKGHHFPVALEAAQEYPILASIGWRADPAVDVVLRWTDGTGPRELS